MLSHGDLIISSLCLISFSSSSTLRIKWKLSLVHRSFRGLAHGCPLPQFHFLPSLFFSICEDARLTAYVCSFPIAPPRNHYELCGFKQCRGVLSCSWRSEVKHPSLWAEVRVSQGWFLPGAPRGQLLLCFCSASGGCLHSLASDPFLCLQSVSYHSLPPGRTDSSSDAHSSCMSPKDLVIVQGPCRSSRIISPSPNSLIIPAESLWTHDVTFMGSLGISPGIFGAPFFSLTQYSSLVTLYPVFWLPGAPFPAAFVRLIPIPALEPSRQVCSGS